MEIVDLLDAINQAGTTVIMVTHEHELVNNRGHRIITIGEGNVLEDAAGEVAR
jgi:cell division transport system ATP-binding protein